MNNSKLTAKLAARYYGCEVLTRNGGIYRMTGIEEDRLNYALSNRNYSYVLFDSDPKLVLTPLSAITDEHAIEVAKIARPEITDYNHLLNIGWGIIGVIKDGYILPELGFKSITAILRKLCEFGYDCDNAISEGWAVDKLAFVK
jgi:hypothetical protein